MADFLCELTSTLWSRVHVSVLQPGKWKLREGQTHPLPKVALLARGQGSSLPLQPWYPVISPKGSEG